MKQVSFILNLPYTILGTSLAVLSGIKNISFLKSHLAIVLSVQSLWWTPHWREGTRAATVGHVVLLSPREKPRDLEHELIHIEQFMREPLIYPFLYFLQSARYGYRENRYEKEAYSHAGNEWIET